MRKGYSLLGEHDQEAIKEYKLALAIDSACTNAWQNIGLYYAKNDSVPTALRIADNALRLCTEDLEDIYRLKANCLADLERYNEALPYYYKALRIEPENTNAIYNLGYSHYMLKKWDSAIHYFTWYVDEGNDNEDKLSDVLFYLGTSYQSRGDGAVSLPYFDRAIALEQFHNYYYNKAHALDELKRYDEAIATLKEGIKNNPNNALLYHKRYQVYRDMKLHDKANADLLKAYSLDNKEADILLDMGNMYENQSDVKKALSFFYQCIAMSKNKAEAYGNIANLYSNNEQMQDSALYYYKQTIKLDPKEAKHFYNFGNYYKKTGDADKAILMYEKAIALNPKLSEPYNNIAVLLIKEDDYLTAKKYILKGLKVAPTDYNLNVKAAAVFQELKQYDTAIIYANKGVELAGNDYNIEELLNIRGISRQILGDYDNALIDYMAMLSKITVQDRKRNPSLLSNIGYCYLENGNNELALQYFKEAVDYKLEVDQLLGLAIVYQKMGKSIKADEALNMAKEEEPLLSKGFAGIKELENQGYFYSKKNKAVLRELLD